MATEEKPSKRVPVLEAVQLAVLETAGELREVWEELESIADEIREKAIKPGLVAIAQRLRSTVMRRVELAHYGSGGARGCMPARPCPADRVEAARGRRAGNA